MAVTKQNRGQSTQNTASPSWTSATYASPPSMSGSDMLLVHICFGNNITVNSITHGGANLTKAGGNWFSGFGQREEWWYLNNPASSGSIVVNLASAMFNGMTITAMGFNGTNGVSGPTFNGGISSPHIRTRTVSEGSMVHVTGISNSATDDITIDGTTTTGASGNLMPNQVNVNDIVSGMWSNTSHSAGSINTETDASATSNITNSYIEILGVISTPTLTVSTTALSGFTYVEGNGPSNEVTFTVSGDDLTANATVSAPSDYEVSLTSGSGFASSVPLTQTSGDIDGEPKTVYVRLKAGLAEDTYTIGNVTVASAGATTLNLSVNGTVTAPLGKNEGSFWLLLR